MSCKDSHKGSLDVETFSGISLQNKVCSVNNIQDVRHIVTFYNLRNYPVDIVCNASIKTNPRKIQFKSTLSNDLYTHDADWKGEIVSLGIKVKQDFSHVQLINLQTGFGNQVVNVEIEADWPQPGKKDQISLSFSVLV